MRRCYRILPLVLLPLFAPGCAEKAEKAGMASAPEEQAAAPTKTKSVADSDDQSMAEPQATASPAPAAPAASAAPMADLPRARRPGRAGVRGGDGSGMGGKGKLEGLQGRKENRLSERGEDKELETGEGKDVPRNMYFQHYGVNPTIDTAEAPKSTFAVDVDTAAYTMARSYLDRGNMPAEAAVRVEELVNAFDYGYEAPTDGKTFNVHAEAAPSPNRSGYHVLHVGIKGKEIAKAERKDANLVFVVDVSGSMDSENRLGLVKKSLRLLVGQLAEADKVGIVTYGSAAREVLQPTSAYNKHKILAAIDGLSTEGATNAEAGLRVGYQMAEKNFRKGAVNRVILCSDGVANVGLTGPKGILATVKSKVAKGITMTTIGVGMGNYNDVLMEQLANKGNGNYFYVDQLSEARRVFVNQLTGTLQTIAKDVKIQIDFDKEAVARYRLIGYENRGLTAREFDNDAVDAGEVGAGHSVTAIYEVKLQPGQRALGKVRVRFKQPEGTTSQLIEQSIVRGIVKGSTDALSSPTQLSLVAAQFGEKLRGSYWARNLSYEDVLARFNRINAPLRQRKDVVELRNLVKKAKDLDRRGDKFESSAGPIAHMGFDRVPVLR